MDIADPAVIEKDNSELSAVSESWDVTLVILCVTNLILLIGLVLIVLLSATFLCKCKYTII